jgi:hypothetical protein
MQGDSSVERSRSQSEQPSNLLKEKYSFPGVLTLGYAHWLQLGAA